MQAAESGPCKQSTIKIILVLSNLYARGVISTDDTRSERRKRSSEKLMTLLASDVPQHSNVNEVLRTLKTDPAALCRMEMVHTLQLPLVILFINGDYVPLFDPC